MTTERFRSEVFLKEDLESILRAIDLANRQIADLTPQYEITIYRAGFTAALHAVAQALHIGLGPAPVPFRVVAVPADEISAAGSELTDVQASRVPVSPEQAFHLWG